LTRGCKEKEKVLKVRKRKDPARKVGVEATEEEEEEKESIV